MFEGVRRQGDVVVKLLRIKPNKKSWKKTVIMLGRRGDTLPFNYFILALNIFTFDLMLYYILTCFIYLFPKNVVMLFINIDIIILSLFFNYTCKLFYS